MVGFGISGADKSDISFSLIHFGNAAPVSEDTDECLKILRDTFLSAEEVVILGDGGGIQGVLMRKSDASRSLKRAEE
jgi:hypothetical protein